MEIGIITIAIIIIVLVVLCTLERVASRIFCAKFGQSNNHQKQGLPVGETSSNKVDALAIIRAKLDKEVKPTNSSMNAMKSELYEDSTAGIVVYEVITSNANINHGSADSINWTYYLVGVTEGFFRSESWVSSESNVYFGGVENETEKITIIRNGSVPMWGGSLVKADNFVFTKSEIHKYSGGKSLDPERRPDKWEVELDRFGTLWTRNPGRGITNTGLGGVSRWKWLSTPGLILVIYKDNDFTYYNVERGSYERRYHYGNGRYDCPNDPWLID